MASLTFPPPRKQHIRGSSVKESSISLNKSQQILDAMNLQPCKNKSKWHLSPIFNDIFLMLCLGRPKSNRSWLNLHILTLGVNLQNPDYIGNIMLKMPKGTKLLSRRLVSWEKARDETVDKIELDSWQAKGGEGPGECEFDVAELCRIGIPSSPEEFVQRATMAEHPKDLVGQIGEIMQKTIWLNFHQPPHVLAKLRIEFVKKYSAMALDLRAEELKLKYSMPKHIKEIMKGKRLALWGKILSDLNYPDTDLVQDMVRGFPLSGWMPRSNVFPHEVRHPKITMEALHDSLELFNLKVKQQMSIRQESQLEEDTWEETMKELEKGWIWRDESTSWEGKCVARRFGIHQGGKTRVIDDCSVCGLNQTVGLREKFVLQAVDQMCAIISWSMKQAGVGQHVPIVGRTFDLKAAYKQFGLCSLDRDLVRIAAVDPATGHAALFGLNALPFGGVGSVAGFLRVSMATWFIGVVGLGICWTGYFDDFSTLSRPGLQNNTTWAVDSLFNLLGLDYAMPKKVQRRRISQRTSNCLV